MILPASPLSTLRCHPSRDRRQDSRPEWIRFSFSVGLSHPLQCAGLSRRSPSPKYPVPEIPAAYMLAATLHYAANRNVSRHAVDTRDLVDEWHWHCLILYCVAFRDLEESWIGFSAIELCDFGGPGARTWIAVYQ